MFRRTVISLTLQYSALLLLVFAAFSVGVYSYTKHSFDRDSSNNANNYDAADQLQATHDLTDADVGDLRTTLLFTYAGLVVVVPVLSYGLARRALRPIAESYQAQQQFVDNASHELRTPLSIIQGELELAVSRPRPKSAYQTAIHGALNEVGTLAQLVEHLLLLARGNYRQLEEHFVSVAVEPLVRQSVATVAETYGKRVPSIRITVPKSLQIYGAPDLIQQALTNVLDNAAKFTPPDGRVAVTASEYDGKVVVRVQDTGRGIEPVNLQRAFDRFWRADSARSVKGHGLGLSVVRQVMEIHHGAVELNSSVGKGTTATLTFRSSRS